LSDKSGIKIIKKTNGFLSDKLDEMSMRDNWAKFLKAFLIIFFFEKVTLSREKNFLPKKMRNNALQY